ncbi:hypothetical protein MtrunA17_Chr8g0336971 [Medicago truncatula]|uniref:Transmembrane protein n=1 Tax=Medicago truncatula TaxID=3880 RepID=A0A396GAM5_MEDTR|nr:hypothetical protein MtrunA17_Chr8g0336971 [Medicago truncatula]
MELWNLGKSGHSCVVTIDLVQNENAGTCFFLEGKMQVHFQTYFRYCIFLGVKTVVFPISCNVKFKKGKRLHLTV